MMCLREILLMYLCLGFVELIGSLDWQSRQFQKKFWPLFLHFFLSPYVISLFLQRLQSHANSATWSFSSVYWCRVHFIFSVFPPSVFQFSVSIDISWSLLFFFSKCLFSVNPRRMSFSYQRFYFLPLEVWFWSFYTFWVSLQYIQPFLQHLGYMQYSHNNCFTILIY